MLGPPVGYVTSISNHFAFLSALFFFEKEEQEVKLSKGIGHIVR